MGRSRNECRGKHDCKATAFLWSGAPRNLIPKAAKVTTRLKQACTLVPTADRRASGPSFPLRKCGEDGVHKLFGNRLLVEVLHRGPGQPNSRPIRVEILLAFLAFS